ncbi:MAG TPA: beta-ketoacyl synthase chain length factor [Tahibacter sp.]|uniref:beta-ketoacyl synthase chain length factor n=1 Tax=Tahibacter sp. TaxID=2056211 RepID=UPI002BEC2729|nr:beta-ketoacyl synthase chain length factor [Tahibacter sp.]HSX58691.1 beta-ketoacyl synthase chain length factor [Tahibacter sp.]
MSELVVRVAGIGVYGPGLTGWPVAAAVLRGEREFDGADPPRPAPGLLPAAERRRAPDTVLYASQAATEACAMAQADPAQLPCIFSSTQGDIAITDYMCATLVQTPRELSPTKFHNSVHNAAAGYWSIATGCREPATALSAWTDSVGAGLLEAAIQVADSGAPVLFAAYDVAAPGPLHSAVPFDRAFALAFVLAPPDSAPGMRLALRRAADGAARDAVDADWARALRAQNASADGLALLQALAANAPRTLHIGAGPQLTLRAEFAP